MAVNAKVASAYVDLVARTAAFKAALEDATNSTKKFAAETRAQMTEAKGSIALLGRDGWCDSTQAPPHVRCWLARSGNSHVRCVQRRGRTGSY